MNLHALAVARTVLSAMERTVFLVPQIAKNANGIKILQKLPAKSAKTPGKSVIKLANHAPRTARPVRRLGRRYATSAKRAGP